MFPNGLDSLFCEFLLLLYRSRLLCLNFCSFNCTIPANYLNTSVLLAVLRWICLLLLRMVRIQKSTDGNAAYTRTAKRIFFRLVMFVFRALSRFCLFSLGIHWLIIVVHVPLSHCSDVNQWLTFLINVRYSNALFFLLLGKWERVQFSHECFSSQSDLNLSRCCGIRVVSTPFMR